jgi:hypothetical protein
MSNHAPIEITKEMVKERVEYYEKILENKELNASQISINTNLLNFWKGYKFYKKKS